MSSSLKVLSYNIWFDKTLYLERLLALLQVIEKEDPDVICLQEVRPNIFEILKNELVNYKFFFPYKLDKTYGCIIFSRIKMSKCLEYKFNNSKMGRSLVIIKIDLPHNIEIVIINSHFESLFNKIQINDGKIEQYKISKNIMDYLFGKYKNVILCADTNVMSHEEYTFLELFENDGWIDCLVANNNQENNYTYDSENNIYLNKKLDKKSYKSRIDRCIFKGQNVFVTDFKTIDGKNYFVEPSDHYGILSTFSIL